MKTKPKHKRKSKLPLVFVLIPILILLFVSTGYAVDLYRKATLLEEKAHQPLQRGEVSPMRAKAEEPAPDTERFSVLLMGVDDSELRQKQYGEAVRTDALLLATFNGEEHSVKLVSIPRDSYVYVPVEKKKDKINHAHAFGGVDATVETVERLLDVPVDYYVKVNFTAFMQIVDALGGVEVDVPIAITEQDSKDRPRAIKLKKGLQTLNGEEALALVRTRKMDSDMERGKRQQLVLEAIFHKALSIGSVPKYGALLEALGDNLKTNLRLQDLEAFYQFAKGRELTIEKLQLQGRNMTLDQIYYYQLDELALEEIRQSLKEHLGLTSASSSRSAS
ncbi:LCP family protein [Brevibacillus composti]|uniref:LCP family protein n=1 Tax=Brevibacillus composti TaxID=2796470 RepID=A0A7T5EMM4_9BACL|nr:LCP family protein [Brevibacillus composti]QQE75353.1 LCP family protein [Brevibacillus composti]QUO42379.1 LCP family protein [Brevibacillus composti]